MGGVTVGKELGEQELDKVQFVTNVPRGNWVIAMVF